MQLRWYHHMTNQAASCAPLIKGPSPEIGLLDSTWCFLYSDSSQVSFIDNYLCMASCAMEKYPLNIPGITDKAGKNFIFNKDANADTFRLLVADIPPQTRVGFYDKKYSSPSDPGAYVIFMRRKDQYIFQRANHGWSTHWKPISVEKLVAYLSRCAKYNYGASPSECMFSFVSIKPPKIRKW